MESKIIKVKKFRKNRIDYKHNIVIIWNKQTCRYERVFDKHYITAVDCFGNSNYYYYYATCRSTDSRSWCPLRARDFDIVSIYSNNKMYIK